MAYDADLARRIRAALADAPAVREVAMFGGLSFMVHGRLSVAADARGDLMIRCDPARVDELVARTAATWAEMKGRRMSKGWIVVPADRITTDEELDRWIRLALEHREAGSDQDGG
jgi:TfoX/Sxy family transcriptional regulator of competence genes